MVGVICGSCLWPALVKGRIQNSRREEGLKPIGASSNNLTALVSKVASRRLWIERTDSSTPERVTFRKRHLSSATVNLSDSPR